METLESVYKILCNISSDINEHLPTLKKYASECRHITEFGVRHGVSTFAFLAGKPQKLMSYDICRLPNIDIICKIAEKDNIDFNFISENTLNAVIEETELLFIDTLHSYNQLKAELIRHGNKSSKYIILHDTTSFAYTNEDNSFGIKGLCPAVEEFLVNNSNWKLKEKFDNCQGLTILERNNDLLDEIIKRKISMVSAERFFTIDYIRNVIYREGISGDIVETGVWAGGMSIYLAKKFPERKIWVCDSFEGCQDDSLGNYPYSGPNGERENHTLGMYSVPLEDVLKNFRDFNLNDSRINFIKGWFRDTINNPACPIENIALLRFDGDAYSAILEVLNGLYDKITPGGFFVIDDSCFENVMEAIDLFQKQRNLKFSLKHPVTLQPVISGPGLPPGVWFRKEI